MKKKKEKSVMQQLREIRDKIGEEMKGMTPEQVKEYLDSKPSLFPDAPWSKKGKIKK